MKDPHPVNFPQSNFTYTRPSSMTEDECGDLPCFRSSNMTISKWRFPSLRERLRFLFKGELWMFMLMDGHPPVALATKNPFEEEKKK